MADLVINAISALFNAEEGTTLATVATIVKYCVFMAIPFVGWSLVEVFFLVISNPVMFAGMWILITAMGLAADYLTSQQRLNNGNGDPAVQRGIPPLLDLRPTPHRVEADLNNNGVTEEEENDNHDDSSNNNFHEVNVEEVAPAAAAVIPDIGTQTPRVSEPPSPPAPGNVQRRAIHAAKARADDNLPVAETQTPSIHVTVNNRAENTDFKQSMTPLVNRITQLAKQLANERDKAKVVKDDTTWILHPPNRPNTAPADPLGNNRILTTTDGPEDFVEVHSVPNSEIFPMPIRRPRASSAAKDKNANK